MLPGHEFRRYPLDTDGNPFAELSASVRFEDVGKGRRAAVLVRPDAAGGVPLVRTTTRYGAPAQRFAAAHERLAHRIRERAALPGGFDNALVECYTDAYRTMGAHSDQALDLADGSFIAVYSCYEHPESADPPRMLKVEPKGTGGETVDIPLTHDSVVVFSVAANRRFVHRIVLDGSTRAAGNRWLGFTFRTSKTLVQFRDGGAYLPDGTRLTPADDDQRREFYHLRRRENTEPDFVYPPLPYTISGSDLVPPDG